MLKALSPVCCATGRWQNLWQVEPNGKTLGHWGGGCALGGDIGT
jgi:hypothetical protein